MKPILNFVLPFCSSLLLLGCSETISKNDENTNTPINVNSQLVSDSIGDLSNKSFDISGAQYQLFEDSIVIKILIDSLSDSLIINKTTTPDNTLEYEFSATFDIGNDSNKNNDIQFSAMHFKFANETVIIDEISNCFQVNAWGISQNGGSLLCDINASFENNEILLSVSKNANEKLGLISPNTSVLVVSSFYDNSGMQSDSLSID